MNIFVYTEGAYSNLRVQIADKDPGQNKFLIFSVGETDALEKWVAPSTLTATGTLNQKALEAHKAALAALNGA